MLAQLPEKNACNIHICAWARGTLGFFVGEFGRLRCVCVCVFVCLLLFILLSSHPLFTVTGCILKRRKKRKKNVLSRSFMHFIFFFLLYSPWRFGWSFFVFCVYCTRTLPVPLCPNDDDVSMTAGARCAVDEGGDGFYAAAAVHAGRLGDGHGRRKW